MLIRKEVEMPYKDREAKNAYSRKWYAKNKDKIKKRRDENAEERKTQHREYYQRVYKHVFKKFYDENKKELNAKSRKYYRENKERLKIQKREYQQGLRLQVLIHYGGDPPKCSCCGESIVEFLTLDHINNDGAEHRKRIGKWSGHAYYIWIIKNNFPPLFQVLCYNCNCAKGCYGSCPHVDKKP